MCSLCGNLGGPTQWTEDPYEAATRDQLAIRILQTRRLTLRTWQGGGYIVGIPDGPTEAAPSLAALWGVMDRASGVPCDPLDPVLLAALDEALS